MLTDKDIKKLTSVFATKKDLVQFATKKDLGLFATKQDIQELREEISGLRETVQGLVTAIDKLAGVVDDLRVEYVMIKNQLAKHDRWIKEIAKKAGVKLDDKF